MHREHFLKCISICRSNACGHYGPDGRGRVGCLLVKGCPCRIDSRLLSGGGCLADPPLFPPSVDLETGTQTTKVRRPRHPETLATGNARRKQESKPVEDNGDWFVAVTTAPRRDCTLTATIDSLRIAGWEPTIFAEPGSTVTSAKTIHNQTRLGVWHNWLASARYAIEQTTAPLILTVQDDCEFHPDSRTFTESILWPSESCGFVSLYTPRHYTHLKEGHTNPIGVNRVRTHSLWGACALAWPRGVLERAVNSEAAKTWSGAPPKETRGEKRTEYKARRDEWLASKDADPSKIANSDTAIGKIVNSLCLTMHFIDPSPVRHIGVHSTIGRGGNGGNRNCGRCADHSIPLVDQVNPVKDSTA